MRSNIENENVLNSHKNLASKRWHIDQKWAVFAFRWSRLSQNFRHFPARFALPNVFLDYFLRYTLPPMKFSCTSISKVSESSWKFCCAMAIWKISEIICDNQIISPDYIIFCYHPSVYSTPCYRNSDYSNPAVHPTPCYRNASSNVPSHSDSDHIIPCHRHSNYSYPTTVVLLTVFSAIKFRLQYLYSWWMQRCLSV